MARGDANLGAEELALLDLLGDLIERFDTKTYITPDGDPTPARSNSPYDGPQPQARRSRRRPWVAREGL